MSSPAESPSSTPHQANITGSPAPSSSSSPPPSLPETAPSPSPSSHPPPPLPPLFSAPAPYPSTPSKSPPPPPPPPLSSSTKLSPSPPPPKSSTPPPPAPPRSNSDISPPPPPRTVPASPSTPASKSPAGGVPSSSSPPPPPSSSSTESSAISGTYLIAVGIAGVLAISVIAVLCYCLCRKKKKKYYSGEYYGPPPNHKDQYYGANMRQQQEWCSPSSNYRSDVFLKMQPPAGGPPSMPSAKNGYDPIPPAPEGGGGGSGGLGNSKSWFTYQELATATNGFARTNAVGEGGFGCVYKGILTDGQVVAVKQLKVGASQGEKEFQAEVEIISRVHHRHLVSLVGYCIADRQRLLVYDYVSNGTLEQHLNQQRSMKGPVMDWPTRVKIACGAARGLAYLHEDCHPRIIHRDIKSSNILLDDNFEAQVSDFGLAKLTTDTNTHVTTRVMGTFGYLAPEYASSGKLTDKSDVFSFGVVLLELITGRKPVDQTQPAGEESLVEWARPIMAQIGSEEDLRQIADPALDGTFDFPEMMRMVEAAAACVRHSATKRPRMGQVVRALEDESSLSDLSRGLKPGQSGVFGSSMASSEFENGSYSADMRRYLKVALGNDTQEFGSECSGATSEYGLNASMSSGEYQMSREMDRSFSQQSRPAAPLPPTIARKSVLRSSSATRNHNDYRMSD